MRLHGVTWVASAGIVVSSGRSSLAYEEHIPIAVDEFDSPISARADSEFLKIASKAGTDKVWHHPMLTV